MIDVNDLKLTVLNAIEFFKNKKFISERDIPHEFYITIGKGIKESDNELFFNFDKERDYVEGISRIYFNHISNDSEITYEDLSVIIGHQPSKSQARKNGWSGKVPKGFSEFVRGKHSFNILNLDESFV